MTKVLSCQVSGLAGRSDTVSHRLDPQTNVFFGPNGTGKTSLLKLIASAVRDDINLIRRVPFTAATIVFETGEPSQTITRTITAADLLREPQQPNIANPQFPFVVLPYPAQTGWLATPPAPQINAQVQPFICTYLSTSRIVSDQFVGMSNESPYSEARLDQIFAFQVLQSWQRYSNAVLTEITQRQEAGLGAIIGSLFSFKSDSEPSKTDVGIAYSQTKRFLKRQHIQVPLKKDQFVKLYEGNENLRAVVGHIEQVERKLLPLSNPDRSSKNSLGNSSLLTRQFSSTRTSSRSSLMTTDRFQ